MARVLITAFEPYDVWKTNASWLALVELTKNLPPAPHLTTRLYPVDFVKARERLAKDLAENFDYALHLGQAPGSARVQLEYIGLNIGGGAGLRGEELRPLIEEGAVAYRSGLPLAQWAGMLREAGIPAEVSYHAGSYLCNATLYWTHHYAAQLNLNTKAAFLHLPLETSQTLGERRDWPSLPATLTARALQLILAQLAGPVA